MQSKSSPTKQHKGGVAEQLPVNPCETIGNQPTSQRNITDGTACDLQSAALCVGLRAQYGYNNEACNGHNAIELCRQVTILDWNNVANYSANWRGNANAEWSEFIAIRKHCWQPLKTKVP